MVSLRTFYPLSNSNGSNKNETRGEESEGVLDQKAVKTHVIRELGYLRGANESGLLWAGVCRQNDLFKISVFAS
jgi:hypothetical protein